MKVSAPSEHHEQATLMQWVGLASGREPRLLLLFAVPNGIRTTKAGAGRAKAEGLRKGVPDLCLPVPSGRYHGLFLELKKRTGGRTSPEQLQWIARLRSQGYCAEVVMGWEAAKQVIEDYLHCPTWQEIPLVG